MKWYKRFTSRKFIVLAAGTALLYFNRLSGWQWIALAVLWIGGNSLDKMIALKRVGGAK